jgi:hypothetical protein
MVTTQNVPPISALVEPAAPMWAQRMVLRLTTYFMPIAWRQPFPIWASTKAQLPPAADFPYCVVVVSDQNELALSLGGAWLKIVTGGPV